MDRTPNLDLPYILPSQAQKHVTHNEAIRALDAIAQAGVLNRTLASAPASPAEGDRHIIAVGATGDWSGHDLEIAAWQDGAWVFCTPLEGWLCWVADEDVIVAWDGSAWTVAGGSKGEFDTVAINGATADATNRIAVNAAATLLNHDGNGHQLKINKNVAGDTASVLFQTGFSGRAEFGTTGDDDWHVKVSPDGSSWTEAVVVDKDNGFVGLGGSPETLLHVIRDGSAAHLAYFDNYGKTANTRWRRANGTIATPTALLSGDLIGNFGFGGYTGSAFSASAVAIKVSATENWSATAIGAAITFFTTPNGSVTSAERMIIDQDGKVGIGTISPSTTLDIDGPARVKSYTVAGVPSASTAGAGSFIYVSDETGGAVLAFSDGTNWRRVTDRAVVS